MTFSLPTPPQHYPFPSPKTASSLETSQSPQTCPMHYTLLYVSPQPTVKHFQHRLIPTTDCTLRQTTVCTSASEAEVMRGPIQGGGKGAEKGRCVAACERRERRRRRWRRGWGVGFVERVHRASPSSSSPLLSPHQSCLLLSL